MVSDINLYPILTKAVMIIILTTSPRQKPPAPETKDAAHGVPTGTQDNDDAHLFRHKI